MRQVSQRWKDSVPTAVRWATEIEWSNDGFRYVGGTAGLIDGSVTADSTNQIRWSSDLTIVDAPFGRDGVNPYTTQFRIKHGAAWTPSGTAGAELLPLGLYKARTANRDRSQPNVIKLTGSSFEQYLLQARYEKPWNAKAMPADQRLQQMVHDVLPGTPIFWQGARSRQLPSVLIERDRWAAIDGGTSSSTSIARAVAARIFCDATGALVVRPVPSLQDKPVWASRIGLGGVLINSTEELTDEYVYNVVVCNGESTDENIPAVGPGISSDDDPSSLTYAGLSPSQGGFGRKPFFYTSQLITTLTQARQTAASLLAPKLGLRQTIAFDQLHDPSIEPGDVGVVTGVDGTDERVILDSVTYDLLGGNLSSQTRTTQTRLAGDQAEASDEDEGEGGGEEL